jgi:hypothetical protein
MLLEMAERWRHLAERAERWRHLMQQVDEYPAEVGDRQSYKRAESLPLRLSWSTAALL